MFYFLRAPVYKTMIKITSLILALSALSAAFLEIPKTQAALLGSADSADSNDHSRDPHSRQLAEPLLCILTVVAVSFLIGFIVSKIKWRTHREYQKTVYTIKTSPNTSVQRLLHNFQVGVYTKEVVNRCLYTVLSITDPQDGLNVPYFSELCHVWGRFIRNHAHMSIKFFDVTYALQFFDLFLARETIYKTSEKEPETVRFRNKRFVAIIESEIEGVRGTRHKFFTQTAAFRVVNSFYGGFWEFIFEKLHKPDLTPQRMPLIRPSQLKPKSKLKTSCIGCF
jgi:hypothetical protein